MNAVTTHATTALRYTTLARSTSAAAIAALRIFGAARKISVQAIQAAKP